MTARDVKSRQDVDEIVTRFYHAMLEDSIIGFIFTDVVKIDLASHLPIIVDFWSDALFAEKSYNGNTLRKHLDINEKLPLKPGHFTRWLYLFNQAVDAEHQGPTADKMKRRAETIAESITAAITAQKRGDMQLTLKKSQQRPE